MAFTAAYTACVSALILLLFIPRIASISHELRQRRMILLLLPPQIVGVLPYVRSLITDVLAESEDAAVAGATVRSAGRRRGSGGAVTPTAGGNYSVGAKSKRTSV